MRVTMPLHLIKLSVGSTSIRDLEEWSAEQRAAEGERSHTTRMSPSRAAEILNGGSMYWVIKGQLCCRERILDLKAVTGEDGIQRCRIVLQGDLIPVSPRPFRPFQGWRYLEAKDAPPDLGRGTSGLTDMPEDLRRELAQLGLL
jgi:hypothetical protein